VTNRTIRTISTKPGEAMTTNNEDYVKELQAELARRDAEREALIAEFTETISDAKEWSPEDLRKKFNTLLATAHTHMLNMLDNTDSDAVRWSIVKFIFSVGLGVVRITDDNSPDKDLITLLESLKADEKAIKKH
jgi:hypothetical protein